MTEVLQQLGALKTIVVLLHKEIHFAQQVEVHTSLATLASLKSEIVNLVHYAPVTRHVLKQLVAEQDAGETRWTL